MVEAQTPNGKERTVRCPRCRARSPLSAGSCGSCNLPMYTKRLRDRLGPDAPRPSHFLSGRFRRARKENATPRPGTRRPREDFSGVAIEAPPNTDLMPKFARREGQAPQATGKTTQYQISDLRPEPKPSELPPDEQPTHILSQPVPRPSPPPTPKPKSKAQSEFDTLLERDQSEEKVETGGMADFLMHPSDSIEQYTKPGAVQPTGAGSNLDMGVRFNDHASGNIRNVISHESVSPLDAPAEAPASAPVAPGGLDIVPHEPAAAPPHQLELPLDKAAPSSEAIRPTAADRRDENYHPWRTAARWVLPQAVLLLILIAFGPKYLRTHYLLAGEYEAVFSDADGRQVTCSTTFRADAAHRFKFSGVMDCQLYPSLTSTERVDEPRVLKPIMGDGKIAFTGRFDLVGLALTLGAVEEGQSRSAILRGRFTPDARHIEGTVYNPLGRAGRVVLQRKPGT